MIPYFMHFVYKKSKLPQNIKPHLRYKNIFQIPFIWAMIQNEESSYKYDQKIQLFFMYVSDENTSNMLHDTTKARIEIRVSMSSEWSP